MSPTPVTDVTCCPQPRRRSTLCPVIHTFKRQVTRHFQQVGAVIRRPQPKRFLLFIKRNGPYNLPAEFVQDGRLASQRLSTLWALWRARIVRGPASQPLPAPACAHRLEYQCRLVTTTNAHLFASAYDITPRCSAPSSTTSNSNPSSQKRNPPTRSILRSACSVIPLPAALDSHPGSSSGRSSCSGSPASSWTRNRLFRGC